MFWDCNVEHDYSYVPEAGERHSTRDKGHVKIKPCPFVHGL